MQIAFSASATSVYHFAMPPVYLFCALFLCVQSCRLPEAGRIWGDTTRGHNATGAPFSYVVSLSTQCWHQTRKNFVLTQMARFVSFMTPLLSQLNYSIALTTYSNELCLAPFLFGLTSKQATKHAQKAQVLLWGFLCLPQVYLL